LQVGLAAGLHLPWPWMPAIPAGMTVETAHYENKAVFIHSGRALFS
jgi:hypothetical protein